MAMAETIAPYQEAYAGFRLEDFEAKLSGSLAGGINACVECCDRWAEPGRVALRWEDQHGHRATVTFAELQGALGAFRQCPEGPRRRPGRCRGLHAAAHS